MSKVYFKRNWCDYLTECPVHNGVMIGSYECTICKDYVESKEEPIDFNHIGDYSKYVVVNKNNYVVCNNHKIDTLCSVQKEK